MRKHLQAILLLASPSFSMAADLHCSDQKDELALSGCLKNQFIEDDKDLNEAYRNLLIATDRVEYPQNLKPLVIKAQRQWLKFRNEECSVSYQFYLQMHLRKPKAQECMIYQTRERTRQINELLIHGGYGPN